MSASEDRKSQAIEELGKLYAFMRILEEEESIDLDDFLARMRSGSQANYLKMLLALIRRGGIPHQLGPELSISAILAENHCFFARDWSNYWWMMLDLVQLDGFPKFGWDTSLLREPCPISEGKKNKLIRDSHFAFIGINRLYEDGGESKQVNLSHLQDTISKRRLYVEQGMLDLPYPQTKQWKAPRFYSQDRIPYDRYPLQLFIVGDEGVELTSSQLDYRWYLACNEALSHEEQPDVLVCPQEYDVPTATEYVAYLMAVYAKTGYIPHNSACIRHKSWAKCQLSKGSTKIVYVNANGSCINVRTTLHANDITPYKYFTPLFRTPGK